MADELFSAPPDLTLVSDPDLRELETHGIADFDRINGLEDVTPERVQYASRLTEDLDRIRAELAARDTRAQRLAEQARVRTADQMSTLQTRVHGQAVAAGTDAAEGTLTTEGIATAVAESVTAALMRVVGDKSTRT